MEVQEDRREVPDGGFDWDDSDLLPDEGDGPVTPHVPYEWQEADIANLLEHNATGFVVAETGAGKSLIGIETGLRSPAGVILVIAPLGTQEDVWREGILRQDPTANVKIVSGSLQGKGNLFDLQFREPGWYIITHQLFTRWKCWDSVQPDLTIVDEAHLLANRETAGWKKLNKLKSKRRMVMSGTIVRNRIENFWGLLRWVYPELNGEYELSDISYHRWVSEYMDTRYDPFRPTVPKVVGELRPGRIAAEIPCYIQHFKRAECCEYHPNGFLENLPEPISIRYNVELSANQKKAIARMESEYLAWLEDEAQNRRALVAKLPIVVRTRLRQMTLGMPSFRMTGKDDKDGQPIYEIWFAPGCESPKADHFHSRLKDTGDEPYLALTSSEKWATEMTRRLNEDWGIPAAKWAGTVSQAQRDKTKEALTKGDIRVIVGVTEAVSTGIDGLQFAASRLYWFDKSQDLTANIQTEGRLDRRGQTTQVVNEEVLAVGSMDKGIVNKQIEKRLALSRSIRRELRRKKIKLADWVA